MLGWLNQRREWLFDQGSRIIRQLSGYDSGFFKWSSNSDESAIVSGGGSWLSRSLFDWLRLLNNLRLHLFCHGNPFLLFSSFAAINNIVNLTNILTHTQLSTVVMTKINLPFSFKELL